MILKLTSKGQLTIPKKIRDHLNLRAGDRVEFLIEGKNTVRMIAITSSIRELKGHLPKPRKKVSIHDMQEAIETPNYS